MAGESKVQVPLGRRHIIKRPRLTRILDESEARVLLLTAPAGYGKTTLAREWLENRPHVWYQGGPASGDVAALALGLADVCDAIVPNAGERMRARLRATSSPERDVKPLADLLAMDLSAWPSDAWLAIDDYQFAIGSEASELFVELLHRSGHMPLLIATRDRPSWVTARHLLYGEVREVGRSNLALTEGEVAQILAEAGRDEASGILALADGWPAVIGLASVAESDFLPTDDPSALYEFFAQELYDGLAAEARAAFCKLAIAPVVTLEIADILAEGESDQLIALGEAAGILTSNGRGAHLMHPLLRQFFLGQLQRHDIAIDAVADRLYRLHRNEQAWDDAFAVIELAELTGHFTDLLDSALITMLDEGRIPTLKHWLAWAEARKTDAFMVELAAVEIAFREGDLTAAEARAAHLAERLPSGHNLIVPCLLLAGKAALMANRPELALAHLDRVAGTETPEHASYEVTWNRFLAAARLELPEAFGLLSKLDAIAEGIADRELRRASARVVLSCRMGSLNGLESLFQSTEHFMSRANDPLVRSSYLLSQAHYLALTGRYRRALDAMELLFNEVSAYGLGFAEPHALTVKAFIHLGLRQFSKAASALSIAEGAGEERRDVYVAMNSTALRARLLLLQGATQQAVLTLSRIWTARPEKSMYAEYLATRALALSTDRRYEEAIEQADESTSLSRGIEAAVLSEAARAVAAVELGREDMEDRVDSLFGTAASTGNYDGLLLACRLSNSLLERLASNDARRAVLARIIDDAGDLKLARWIGVELRPRPTTESLTPRERQVYELLAQGLTNKEIAAALFISEPTAKLHTLHVRAKLGLRSRTEVVLHANSRAGGYATAPND